MSSLANDVRMALRTLLRRPVHAGAVVLILALGIGAVTAVFTLADAVLLAPLPFLDEERLVRVYEHDVREGRRYGRLTAADFQDYREQAASFSALAALRSRGVTLTGTVEAQRLSGLRVSGSLFDVLGVGAARGRVFEPSDESDGAPCAAVLTNGAWQRIFGGDPGAVDRPVALNGEPCIIVGVLPPAFVSPLGGEVDVFVAEGFHELASDAVRGRRMHVLAVVGRLAPGTDLRAGAADLAAIADRLERLYPQENSGHRPNLVPLRESLVRDARPLLRALSAAVLLLLVLSVVNVAGIGLARALARQRDLAVHAAVGGSRGRLVRALVVEMLVLGVPAAVAGTALAQIGVEAFVRAVGGDLPTAPRLSWRVLAFVVSATVAAGLAAGLGPSLAATRLDVAAILRGGGRTSVGAAARTRLRSALVATQVTLAAVLLVGCGLLLRTVSALERTDPGFDPTGVWLMRTSLPQVRYDGGASRAAAVRAYLDSLRALPGVTAAAASYTVPFEDVSTTGLRVAGAPVAGGPDPEVGYNAVSADYFRVLGIPVVGGRALDESDVAGAPPVVVVNESLARRFFPGQDPVGRLVGSGNDTDAPPLRIVGVVGDVRRTGLDSEPQPELFFSLAQDTTPSPLLLVRTEPSVAGTLPAAARRQLRGLDPELPLYAVRPLTDLVAETIAPRRLVLDLLAAFSCCALLLAAVGVYGVVAQSVVQRRQEIGLRLAVGASGSHVLRMVMREGMRPVAVGVLAGAAVSSAFSRSVAALLHGVTPTDPLTHAGVLVLVAGVAAFACYVPARRAAALDPGQTLRSD